MRNWPETWWPWLLVFTGVLAGLWRAIQNLRRVGRVFDAILGYQSDDGRHIPGVAERVHTLEERVTEMERILAERVTALESELADAKRLLAIALGAQGLDPDEA